MNANLERRWIESEAEYEARKPRRNSPASSKADPNDVVANGVRHQDTSDDSNRGTGSVKDAATESVKYDPLEDSDDDDNDASGWTDLFTDPDPMDEFRFRFELPVGHAFSSNGDDDDKSSPSQDESHRGIDIRLVGYKAELGQTLHSTGLTLWRASSLLCEFLLQHPGHVRGKSVVELGAGLGLCGILASHLRASNVVLTDGDSDALRYLRANVERNVPQPQKRDENDDECVSAPVIVRQLIWGEAVTFPRIGSERFDTVLGSDIIYVEEILEPLWRTVDDLMSPDGAFLLAFARRNVPIDRVFETAATHGFDWTRDDSSSEGVVIFRRAQSRYGSSCERAPTPDVP